MSGSKCAQPWMSYCASSTTARRTEAIPGLNKRMCHDVRMWWLWHRLSEITSHTSKAVCQMWDLVAKSTKSLGYFGLDIQTRFDAEGKADALEHLNEFATDVQSKTIAISAHHS